MKMKTVHIPVITHSRTFGNDLFNFPENNKYGETYEKPGSKEKIVQMRSTEPLKQKKSHVFHFRPQFSFVLQNSEPNLNLLIPESHSPGSINCKWADCGKFFKYLDDLASHVSTFHSNSGPGGLFYCRWDGCTRGERGFNARYKMLVHVRTHTNEKPHQCFQCHKSFSRAENLKIHARSHTGERPYVCPVPGCGKAYSNSSDRFKHTRTHSVHKPYVCKMPSCGKSYTDPSSLRKHVKTYRHYLTAFGTADENSLRKINAEEANGAEDRVENQRHCDIENAENGLPFAVLKKWLRSDSVFKSFANTTGFQKTEEDFRRGVIYQEQESPLDLTIRK